MVKVPISKAIPESKALQKMIIDALENTNSFDVQKKENARNALKKLRENRNLKSLEYIIQITSKGDRLDYFKREVFDTATRYLIEIGN